MVNSEIKQISGQPDGDKRRAITRGLRRAPGIAQSALADYVGRTVTAVFDALPNKRRKGDDVNKEPSSAATLTISWIDGISNPHNPQHPALRVRDFMHQNIAGAESFARHYAGGYVDLAAALSDPLYQEQRREQFKKRHPGMTDTEVDERLQTQEDRIIQRLNNRVHMMIKNAHGTPLTTTQEAAAVFQRARNTADEAVTGHAELVFSGNDNALLRDEVAGEQAPAELLRRYFDPATDRRTQFELRRQLLLAEIAMRQEHKFSNIADRKLEQIRRLLRDKFYKYPDRKPVAMTMWGVFNNETNALSMNEDGTPRLLRDESKEDAPSGSHYKRLTLPVVELEDGGHIIVLSNIKNEGPAARKPLRKAMEREDYPDNDIIDVANDMQDTHRMKIVVLGTQADSDRFSERFFDELTNPANNWYFYDFFNMGLISDSDGLPVGIPTGKGEIQYGAKPGLGKSPDRVNYTKLMLEYAGMENPVKVVVQPLHSFITEQLEVGRFDPEEGKMSGSAHDTVKIQREFPLSGILFPRGIFRGLQRVQQGNRQPHSALEAKANELLTSREYTLMA